MRVISLKRETELLRRNNKSLLRSPHPISSLKTPLRVYHSLKSVTHKNNYVWGWKRNNLNKPRPPRYVWDVLVCPWSILFIKVTMIALLFSIFIVYEHLFGFCPMSCTVILLAICASSRMHYGFKQKLAIWLSFLQINKVIKLVDRKKLHICIRINENWLQNLD